MRHRLHLRHLAQMLGRHGRVFLPAGIAEHDVAGHKPRRLRRHDFGDAAAGHHRVGLDRGAIGRAMHPCPVGGVERDIAHAQQRLAVFRFRDGRLGHPEMFRPEFSGRLLHQQDLAIDVVVHGVSSLEVALLDAVERRKCAACTHCALRTTLVGGRSSRNGNIVANAPTRFEACCVGAEICQTRCSRNLRG